MYDSFKRGLLDLPEVESVAFSSFGTYEMSRWTEDYTLPDGSNKLTIDGMAVTDDYFKTMEMTPTAGRFFPVDDGADAARPSSTSAWPTSTSRQGSDRPDYRVANEDKNKRWRYRVTGVVDHFRSQGEFMDPVYFMLPRYIPAPARRRQHHAQAEARTPRIFETRLNAKLKQIPQRLELHHHAAKRGAFHAQHA
jgi:putative ABC transport system permease protein